MEGLESAELPADAVEVGRVLDAWGIKGGFRVQPYSASPEALFSSRRWYLEPPERGPEGFVGTRCLRIQSAREHGRAVLVTAQDISDRSAAEKLRGARIFVPRSSFPTPKADEYYWVDLIGLTVRNREGLLLGTVRDLMPTGPQTVLVVAPKDPAQQRPPILIPFVAAFVDDVDLGQRVIAVDWQPDY